MRRITKLFIIILLILGHITITHIVKAQYFGQNKPIYKKFKYDVYQTPHFEIYHYFKNDTLINRLAQASDKWYNMHFQVFRDSIKDKNPILFYANQADFQQTTAIQGSIGIGTGGVTEALKNRVVLPVTETWAQTDHVLGHELVHAFQYHSLIHGDSTNLNSVRNLPLWMVEGMSEYLSIGSNDYQTAIWMRDAVLNNKFPTLEEMTRDMNSFFPYRWGHAFWAFIGRTFGDSLINPIFRETAKRGYDIALRRYVGIDEKSFSSIWKQVFTEFYKEQMKDSVEEPSGKLTIFEKNAGQMNISPSISPDGRYLAFYSERDLFSIDLYMANAATGKIIRKLSSVVHENEIDALNFIESAGTWSPDSRQFAFIGFSKGRNVLIIVDVLDGKLVKEFTIPGVPSFNYPAWSPTGESIVVSGLVEGKNDLFLYNLKNGKVKQLTNDFWCNIHPSWSADGRYIVYSTDEPSASNSMYSSPKGYYLATLDVNNGTKNIYYFFPDADNLNPQFSSDGKKIFFLSNSDGFRNLYSYDIETGDVYRQTRILTGISGITPLAPAMSLARETDEVCYSHYFGGKYSIYTADQPDFSPVKVNRDSVNFTASTLPPLNRAVEGIIDNNLANMYNVPKTPVDSFKTVPFKPKFKLDYISNMGGIGIGASQFGTAMSGGVEMLFSDITGANMIYTGLSINGEIYDFGGQVTYINQRKYITWGVYGSHVPFSTGWFEYDTAHINGYVWDVMKLNHLRIFESSLGGISYFPLSQTIRFELGGSVSWYNYRLDVISNYYDPANPYGGYYQRYDKNVPTPYKGFQIERFNVAWVLDNSSFGIASPAKGLRARFQVDQTLGDISYFGTLLDARKYFFFKPYTIAIRGYYYGRHFGNSDQLYDLFIGYPWYVRGYERAGLFDNASLNSRVVTPNQLTGDQMVLASAEFRIPFTGPKRLTMFKSNFFFTELAFFTDAGIAWKSNSNVSFKWQPNNDPNDDNFERIPIFSTGVSLRINLFGMLVLEPYYAIPFQLGGFKSAYIGLNFLPGW